jgi:hypothetical protein
MWELFETQEVLREWEGGGRLLYAIWSVDGRLRILQRMRSRVTYVRNAPISYPFLHDLQLFSNFNARQRITFRVRDKTASLNTRNVTRCCLIRERLYRVWSTS